MKSLGLIAGLLCTALSTGAENKQAAEKSAK